VSLLKKWMVEEQKMNEIAGEISVMKQYSEIYE
jgi:hypothetical protein